MEIYIIVLLFLSVTATIGSGLRQNKLLDKTTITTIFLVLCLMATLRYYVGVDYKSYLELYTDSEALGKLRESGYIILVNASKWMGMPFTVFSMLFSAATLLLIFRFADRNTPRYTYLSILIYYCVGNYYFSTYNVVRQSLTTAIFINCLPLIPGRKFLWYTIIIIATALCVHYSAIFLLVFYFLLGRRFNLKIKLLTILVTCISGSVIISVISSTSYAIYLYFDAFASKVPPTYYLLAVVAVITFIYAYRHPEWERKHLTLCNLNFVAIILIILLFKYENTPLAMIFHRLLNYVNIIYIVIIPLLCSTINSLTMRRFVIFSIIVMSAALCYVSLERNGESNELVPYRTVFSAPEIP